MISSALPPTVESLHSLQSCKDFAEQFSAQIEQKEQRLKELERVKKYTPEIKKEIQRLKAEIAHDHEKRKDMEVMLELPVGSWVRNGSTRPGQITDLRIVGKIPETLVLWWNSTVPIPERPRQLKLLEPSDLDYIWNGDRIPKLIRRIDHWECDDPEILQDFLKRAKTCKEISEVNSSDEVIKVYQQQISYLTKRLKWLTRPQLIAIKDIKRYSVTQQRTGLNHEVVNEYAEAISEGDRFPPIKVKYDGFNYWLTDGFHTTEAAWSIGKTEIEAVITKGTLRDAILDSVGVNAEHGLRRSRADKRRAVTTLLQDPEWRKWSDREIARRCKVSNTFVSKFRNEFCNTKNDNKIITDNVYSNNHKNYINKYGNVSQMNTANIGSDFLNGSLMGETPKTAPVRNNKDLLTNNAENINKDESTGNQKLIEQFEIGQLVKLQLSNFDGASSSLKLANHSYGQITALTKSKCNFNVKIFGHKSFVVSPQDIQPVDFVRFCVEFTPKQFIALMSIHQTRGCLEEALKKGVLGN
jgi:hypothetical protein